MRPRLLHLRPRRAGITIIRVRMSAAIRLVRIMLGEPGLLSGAHVRLRLVRRLGPPRDLPHDLQLVQLVAVAGAVAEAAAAAGEV